MTSEVEHSPSVKIHVLHLPPEITSLIFEFTCGQSVLNDHDPLIDPKSKQLSGRPEMIISHICQHWRAVALSCPTIWSHLVIHNWSIAENNIIEATPLLSMYLARSGGVPLDITVTIKRLAYHPTRDPCTVALRELLLVILPHATRWQRLVIWIEGQWNSVTVPFSSLENVRVPLLEVLEVGIWPIWINRLPSPRDKKIITLFQPGAAPNLGSVLLPSELLLPPNGYNISSIYLHRGEYTQPWANFAVLLGLPNLTALTLDGAIFSAPTSSESAARRVMAPKLRYFRLGCRAVYCNMWHTLSMPNLVLLILFDMGGLVSDNTAGAFPGGFFPELKTLAFWEVDFNTPEDLDGLCLATPQVTELTISNCQDDGVLLASLYFHSVARSTHLWPQLRSLTYTVHKYTEICFGNTAPGTYKAARRALMQLVNWRTRTFGQECTLWVEFHGNDEFLYRREEPYDIPPFDDSSPERSLWQKLFMLPDRQILPWPPEEEGRFSYREKVRFSNESVRREEIVRHGVL